MSLGTFQPHLRSIFHIKSANRSVPVALVAARDKTRPGDKTLEAFSVVFRGPKKDALPQGIYPIQHESLGTFELFLQPIPTKGDAQDYDAVFTRLKPAATRKGA